MTRVGGGFITNLYILIFHASNFPKPTPSLAKGFNPENWLPNVYTA